MLPCGFRNISLNAALSRYKQRPFAIMMMDLLENV